MKLKQKLKIIKGRYGRIGVYILAYIFILFIILLVSKTSLIKPIDEYIYGEVYLNTKEIGKPEDKFIFIDLPYRDNKNKLLSFEEKRTQTYRILNAINEISIKQDSKDQPTIILDITYSRDKAKLDTIIAEIDSLNKKGIKVYGVYKMPAEKGTEFSVHDEMQADTLYYDYFEGGRLHTQVYKLENDIYSYKSVLQIKYGASEVLIPALPIKVIDDYLPDRLNNDDILKPTYYTLPYLNILEKLKDQTYIFPEDSLRKKGSMVSKLDTSIISGKFILAGFHDEDFQIIKKDTIAGPYLVAMAIWNELSGHKITKQAYDNKWFHLGLEIFCILLIVFMFDLTFKRIKKLQTRLWLIAVIAFIIGILILYLIGLFLLSANAVIRPSTSILSMLLASIFIWQYKRIFIKRNQIEGGAIYDVFISYSRAHKDWVNNNVLIPLKSYKKPDGSKLNIFFDKNSIPAGSDFFKKIKNGIINSKMFIPIVSEDFFDRDYCEEEWSNADNRRVIKKIDFFPIALKFEYVPEEHHSIGWVDASTHPEFIKDLLNILTKMNQKS